MDERDLLWSRSSVPGVAWPTKTERGKNMPHEVDGNRALYARTPAWHHLGKVKEGGWFTAEEALAVLNPNNEPVRKGQVFIRVLLGDQFVNVPAEEYSGNVRINPDTNSPQVVGVNGKEYGLIQIEDQFRFMDEVVGAIGGAHYEAAVNLRNGRQTALTIATGAINLDPNGRNDTIKKFIFGTNSFDGSWAFRLKMINFRVECANMARAALRGSSDKLVDGDWSTKHTKDVLNRTEMAKATLGLHTVYNEVWTEQAEQMIQTEMTDDRFSQLLDGLFETEERLGVKEKDQKTIDSVRTIYELSPTCERIHGTIWGGLQAVIEHEDWFTKVRGGKASSVFESRLRRQMGDTDKGLKDRAWDRFWTEAVDSRKVKVRV